MLPAYITHPVDRALMGSVPTLMVPNEGELPPISLGSHRLLMARTGLFIEAKTTALHLIFPMWETPRPLPYGDIKAKVDIAGGLISTEMMAEIYAQANAHAPNEWACRVMYDRDTDSHRLDAPQAINASSAGHIQYDLADTDPDTVVMDLHTHGTGKAYFSPIDDADDTKGGIYLATVLGGCGPEQIPHAVTRVNIRGFFYELPWNPWRD